MKVVLSLLSVPAKAIVWGPLLDTEKGMLNAAKAVLGGDTKPIWIPSTLTLIGCM